MVILRDNGLPRRAWKLAKVVELIKGKDSQIRSAKIELFNETILERAASYLYPLEIKAVIANEDEPAKSSTSSTSTHEGVKKLSTRKAATEHLTE